MRTGPLSDENAVAYNKPLEIPTNERFLGHHHADKQQKQSRKRKEGHKNTPRARYPQNSYHDLAQLIDDTNTRPHTEVFENQARSYANPRPTQSFQAAVKSFRKSYPDLFASTRLANNPFIMNNPTVGRKNLYPESAYFFSQLDNIDVMNYFLHNNTLSGHYLNLPLHTCGKLIRDKPERSVEFEKLYEETMEQFLGDTMFKRSNVRPARLNLPPDPTATPPATPTTPTTPTTQTPPPT